MSGTCFQPRPSLGTRAAGARPTLFLDFDGVLHPALAPTAQYFSRMPLLEQAVAGRPIDIIISSSWRLCYPLPELLVPFPPGLEAAIIGTTGDPGAEPHSRWHEIKACADFLDLRNWRALDDSGFEFPDPSPGLILCDDLVGLDTVQAGQLAAWLAGA